jgi:EAL domain-containing protein (putative c-di-GMP-specific phosphodiesterase class I)
MQPKGANGFETDGAAALSSLLQAEPAATLDSRFLLAVVDLGKLPSGCATGRAGGAKYQAGLISASETRIRQALGEARTVVPLDIDCFAFLLPDDDAGAWESTVSQLITAFDRPIYSEGLPGGVNPSVGLCRFSVGAAEPTRVSATAMSAAKAARDNEVAWRLKEDVAGLPNDAKRLLASGIVSALEADDQLSLVYQPRIDLRSGICSSAEALLRWNHPTLGAIAPSVFIPLVEQHGMMRFVTSWVLKRAIAERWRWSSLGFSQRISINVSASNLSELDFAERLQAILAENRVDPVCMELEITEDSRVCGNGRALATITKLRNIGVRLSIDDFGAEDSNLEALRTIPIHTLKIDRRYIVDLSSNPHDAAIVRAVVELAHVLGIEVVAEGIEDAETLAKLSGWGCDEGQGYYICRPVPPDAFLTWLSARS